MMKSIISFRWFIIALFAVIGQTSVAAVTYRLQQVTEVKANGMYVFEQDGHVMNNSIASNALQTTAVYDKSGLTGKESYVWKLETSKNDCYYIQSVAISGSSKYLTNKTSTNLSLDTKTAASEWEFHIQEDNTFIIQTHSDKRFLGYTDINSYVYKAYSDTNLSIYPHAIVVYELIEDDGTTDEVTKKNPDLSFDKEIYRVKKGETFVAPTLHHAEGYDGSISYSSTDEKVAIVNASTGEIEIIGGGTTVITAKAEETTNFNAGKASYTLEVSSESGDDNQGDDETDDDGIVDGVFDFTLGNDYGSGMNPNSQPNSIDSSEKIWTAGHVTMVTYGRARWSSSVGKLFLYSKSTSDKVGTCEISVPDGRTITKIVIDGNDNVRNFIVDCGEFSGNTWTGNSQKVILQHDDKSAGIEITKITITYVTTAVNVEIGETGYITYHSEYALDFYNVTAYVVSEVDETTVTLAEIKAAPANTPVILHAPKGLYSLGVIESAADVGTNYLHVSDGQKKGGNNIYALADRDGVVGFHVVDTSVVIPEGKCYLETDGLSKTRLEFNFGVVDALDNVGTDNVVGDGIYYNLNGQRVLNPSKGIYILNRRKVLVK